MSAAASSERSPSSSSSSSSAAAASARSLASIDGDHLYQLACVETFLPLSKDVTPLEEPVVSQHPVARIDYSPNFQFIYGLYRALRCHVEYADTACPSVASAPPQPRQFSSPATEVTKGTSSVIRALHTSPARWLLLLGFALRQCTSNYTVWKDRRDVVMSPQIMQQCTRDQLPALSMPDVLLSPTASEAAKAKALTEMEEKKLKVEQVAQHWLPGKADLCGSRRFDSDAADAADAEVSPWRAVHWELNAVGCFTRFYHKNFQVWHHRRELFTYALGQLPRQQSTQMHVDPARPDASADTQTARKVQEQAVSATNPLLSTEKAFSTYLEQHHGLRFADVDERTTVKAVLCDEDSKNYHAWLHLTWYLHALPFLLQLPHWAALKHFADAVVATPAAEHRASWAFTVHPGWAFAASESPSSAVPASRLPTLPPSPFTDELNFTALLIAQDCLNNSAWCHRYSLFKEDLMRRLWREHCPTRLRGSSNVEQVGAEEFQHVVFALCVVEVDFALQWLYVDPTNEAAYTHARAIAVLYHTIAVRVLRLRRLRDNSSSICICSSSDGDKANTDTDAEVVLLYLRDAPLCAPVAALALDLCATADDSTVASATPSREALLRHVQQHPLPWATYADSFSLVMYMQGALSTAIRTRVRELEEQAARVLRAVVSVKNAHEGATPTSRAASQKIALVGTLYERSSQYMLDNFHQVDTAQYLACQAVLEEMWTLYLSPSQRRAVQQARPPAAYQDGVKPEWVVQPPWEAETETAAAEKDDPAVKFFLRYEASALHLAKRLTVLDPIRFKYWKYEAMTTMQRGYGQPL